MSGMHGSRRHQRVRRKSRYEEWVADAFHSSLVGHWPYDEPTGATTAEDVAGANDGTFGGGVATQQGSRIGGVRGSAYFDGSTGECNLGASSDFDYPASNDGAFSWFVWVNLDTDETSATEQTISQDIDSNNRWFVGNGTGGWFCLAKQSGSTTSVTLSEADYKHGSLVLIGMSIDWSVGDMKLYVDDRTGTASLANTTDDVTSDTANVFAPQSGQHPGWFQHVMHFSKRLTDQEAAALYEQGADFFDRGRLL